jgi:hypothetical protein
MNHYKTAVAIVAAVNFVVLGIVAIQNKNLILYHWNLRQLQQASGLSDKLGYADEIASLADTEEKMATTALETITNAEFPQADKHFLIAALFVPQAKTAKLLEDLLSYVSKDSCRNADVIYHTSIQSFQHGFYELGWKYHDLASNCSTSCNDCLIAAFTILGDLPASEIEQGKLKLQMMEQSSSSAQKLVTLTYLRWAEEEQTTATVN